MRSPAHRKLICRGTKIESQKRGNGNWNGGWGPENIFVYLQRMLNSALKIIVIVTDPLKISDLRSIAGMNINGFGPSVQEEEPAHYCPQPLHGRCNVALILLQNKTQNALPIIQFSWFLYKIVAHFTLRTNFENKVFFRKKTDLTTPSV